MLKELIETMVRALVDNLEQVKVSEIEGGMTSIIELRVAKPDIGKVIGKQGRNVDAMRTILSAASTKIRKRVILEIIVRKRAEEISNRSTEKYLHAKIISHNTSHFRNT